MKIFVGTQEEPFYLPLFFERLVELLTPHEIVGVNILAPFNSQSSWRDVARDYWGMFGAWGFLQQGTLFAWHKVADRLGLRHVTGRPHSVHRVFRAARVPIHTVFKQNTDAFRALLDCDLFVSVANPRILKTATLGTPRLGAINFHSGYLPRYRGINPCFWSLLNRETETGFTVHRMTESIDGGPILAQQVVPIDDDETLHTLFTKVTEIGPKLVADTVHALANGSAEERPNDADRATYFGFPSPEDGKRFRAMGLRFR